MYPASILILVVTNILDIQVYLVTKYIKYIVMIILHPRNADKNFKCLFFIVKDIMNNFPVGSVFNLFMIKN